MTVAGEDERRTYTTQWDKIPSRLPKPLSEAGFSFFSLCPADNALARTRYLERHFPLQDVQSSRHVEARLATALRACQPRLIVPGDERTVALLHDIVRQTGEGGGARLTAAERATVLASLAPLDRLDAMLMKSDTLDLAVSAGVRVPARMTVDSPEAAVRAAEAIGFPVYLKTSFSWAGRGVTCCHDAAEVQQAMAAAQSPAGGRLRRGLKGLLGRAWYPTESEIDVQQAIEGEPAMYCAVAVAGRMVGGFAGVARQTTSSTGPSSVVWVGPHEAMARASAAMIAALGATGFIGFDFMIEPATGEAYLLECNPRPIQVCHLGGHIGANLCEALRDGLASADSPVAAPSAEATVPLFPQEWLRDPLAMTAIGATVDVPWDDPGLLAAMVGAAKAAA